MKKKLLILALLLASCATPVANNANTVGTSNPYVSVHHDDQRNVTCWIFYVPGGAGGISCLPDSSFAGKK